MRCEFQTAVSGHTYHYAATITNVGIDIGFTGESTLVWTVLGSTTDLPGEALEGSYGGVTAAQPLVLAVTPMCFSAARPNQLSCSRSASRDRRDSTFRLASRD